ncbi:hypothetical protein W5A_01285 [Imtechella halotolerans K1]|uniref:DUF4382 domain-containing protein n=2 Tax=Imtechella TaxID=1165076 RepID=I0WJP8_9FLAO|nr:hypothetical protein W5A_01285 [Imtechella halotolerans K1]
MAIVTFSCSDNDSGTSRVVVSMTDAPGDYDAVNVDVVDVKIKRNAEGGEEEGWESIGGINPGIYNLLDLTGGVSVVLGDAVVPSGYINQIRLVLGTNNTIVVDGVEMPLSTPSAMQSGLKLNLHQELQSGYTYEFLMDFDVDKSIVSAGTSGTYNLKPVIRITSEATSGIIKGKVMNADVAAVASVMVGETEVTANTNEEGVFALHGIPSGTYIVTITPDASSGLNATIVESVVVVNGQVTDIGEITLE